MPAAKKRILIVEDDPAIRTMEERILGASGFEVVTAGDGTEGMRAACEGHFDLFLLDVMMPGLTGFELARALRGDPRTLHTPILFATARGEPDDIARGFQVGAALYLVKPFTTATLLTMVRAAMGE